MSKKKREHSLSPRSRTFWLCRPPWRKKGARRISKKKRTTTQGRETVLTTRERSLVIAIARRRNIVRESLASRPRWAITGGWRGLQMSVNFKTAVTSKGGTMSGQTSINMCTTVWT